MADVKKTVQIDLEVDTTTVNSGTNPYMNWVHLARAVDSLFLTTYIILLYKSTIWFMELPDPTSQQAGLISVIVGAGAAWFGLYAGTSKSSDAFKGR